MQNTLSFQFTARTDDGAIAITPCVDGVPLSDLAETFERNSGFNDPAGGYGGLIPEFFNYGPLSQYFLGESKTALFAAAPGRIYALGCECGEVGCWPLTCIVECHAGEVLWRDFEQPHRKGRDYSRFGPFVFSRYEYETALKFLQKETL